MLHGNEKCNIMTNFQDDIRSRQVNATSPVLQVMQPSHRMRSLSLPIHLRRGSGHKMSNIYLILTDKLDGAFIIKYKANIINIYSV